jgi:hypothetical protein
MSNLILAAILFATLAALFTGAWRALFAAVDRLRREARALRAIEQDPRRFDGAEAVDAAVDEAAPPGGGRRHHFALTGLFLTVAGIAALLAGREMRVGELAVGLFAGGGICLCLGVLLAVFGLVVHTLDPRR